MSTPYGMPPTPPTGAPPLPPAKSRTPLYIALACGCVLVLLLVLGGAGLGFYLLGQDGGEEPTSPPSSIVDPPPSEDPSDDPTDDPSSPTSEAPTEIELYPGTSHGFAFPQRAAYDKPAAERHWERLITLFRRNLGSKS